AMGDLWGVASTSLNLGNSLKSKAVNKRAVKYMESALETFEKIGNQHYAAHAQSVIGNYWLNVGDCEKALEWHKKSLKGNEDAGDRAGVAIGLHNIGVVYSQTGEFDQAFRHLKQSLEIREDVQDRWGIAFSYEALGYAHLWKGEFEEALWNHNESLKIRNEFSARPLTIYNYTGIAELYVRKGDMVKAMEFCNKAIELSEAVDSRGGLSDSCWISGMIHSHLENWEAAIADFEKCIDISKEMGHFRLLGKAYLEFGIMWKAKGDVTEAENCLRKSLDIFEKLKLTKDSEDTRAALKDLEKSV
ncbi:MAG: tetratricopeptide repeat protein, partial [Thermoplasmata archaeon]|nr:tetratricopeptide repeat protein [Thermoplasmata archaeon]